MYYTKEEIEVLKETLPWTNEDNINLENDYSPTFREPFTVLNIYDQIHPIVERDLESSINGYLPDAGGFLHATPLELVPLYVNDIPELARWRLMIAR